MTPPLPTIPFGPNRVTRLISGGNPLCGNSHFSKAMDREMRDYFTDAQVVRYLRRVEEAGIDTLQARGDYHRVLHWVELHRREGGKLQWVAQTASEMSNVFQNIRVLAAAGVIGIYHHGTQNDRWWHEGKIDRVRDYLKCIRDCGVQVGLGTHIPEVIDHAESHGWDLDFYMASLYNLSRKPRQSTLVAEATPSEDHGRASIPACQGQGDRHSCLSAEAGHSCPSRTSCRTGMSDLQPSHDRADIPVCPMGVPDVDEEFRNEDPAAMCRAIRSTSKTCLAFKILGAGRRCATGESVRDAFRYALTNIKPTDALVVGMFPRDHDQAAENVALVRELAG